MTEVPVSCRCGTVKATLLEVSPKAGTRVMCYCRDCQAAAKAMDAGYILNDRGGTDIFQTVPSNIRIDEGEDRIACMRLSPKGLLRWYADCCGTPVFNTLPTEKLVFAGTFVGTMKSEQADSLLGPVRAVNKGECAKAGEQPIKTSGIPYAGWQAIRRHLRAKWRGETAPLLKDASGVPVVKPRVLSLEERKAATPE